MGKTRCIIIDGKSVSISLESNIIPNTIYAQDKDVLLSGLMAYLNQTHSEGGHSKCQHN